MKQFADLYEAAEYIDYRSGRILHRSDQVLEQARELLAKTDVARIKNKSYFHYTAKRL